MKHCQACKREFKEEVRFCPFDGEPIEAIQSEQPPQKQSWIGQVLDGKFRLEARLRREPLATTYGATQLQTGRPVSLKVLQVDGDSNGSLDALREQANRLASIRHPNIVEVIEAGATDEPHAVYAATEFADGISLKARLAQRGALDETEAAAVIRQLCSATEEINNAGLFSAGLSSENIWLDYSNGSEPHVKVDFVWLSQPLTPETKARIQRGEIVCDPTYLSPEECRGEDPNKRSEVYRLGLIAYEMLAARPPFQSDSVARLILMQLNEAPLPIDSLAPQNGVPHLIEPGVMRALAKLAQYRHQSPAEFERVIERAESAPKRGSAAPKEQSGAMVAEPGAQNIACNGPVSNPHLITDNGEIEKLAPSEPPSPLSVVNDSEVTTTTVVPGENDGSRAEFVFVEHPELPSANGSCSNSVQAAEGQDCRTSRPFHLDDRAQFSVFSPKVLQPLVWSRILSFAHLVNIEEIASEGDAKLRKEIDQYQTVAQHAVGLVWCEDQITIVPTLSGVEFNPPSVTFWWQEQTHSQEFLVRAIPNADGLISRGRVSVFLGSILIAEVPLSVRIDSRYSPPSDSLAYERTTSERFKKIYASYPEADTVIAGQYNRIAEEFGEKYLRDVRDLRRGGAWGARLEKLILEADVFQLFWSSNSMSSELMKQEWEYALSLRRPGFVRPGYWEEPIPSSPQEHLPPEELTRLGFQRIGNSAEPSAVAGNKIPVMTDALGSGSLASESNPRIPVADANSNSEFEFNETPPRAPEPVWTAPEHRSEPHRREQQGQRVPVVPANPSPADAAILSVPGYPAPAAVSPQRGPAPRQFGSNFPAPAVAGANDRNAPYHPEFAYAPVVAPAQASSQSGSATLILKVLVFVLSGCLLMLVLLYLVTRFWY